MGSKVAKFATDSKLVRAMKTKVGCKGLQKALTVVRRKALKQQIDLDKCEVLYMEKKSETEPGKFPSSAFPSQKGCSRK